MHSICYDVTGQYDISLTLWIRCKSPPLQSSKLHWYWLYWIDYIFCWRILWSFARSSKPIITNVWFSVIGLNIMNMDLCFVIYNCRNLLILRNCRITHSWWFFYCHQLWNLELVFRRSLSAASKLQFYSESGILLTSIIFCNGNVCLTTDLLIQSKYFYLILKIFFQKNVSNLMWKKSPILHPLNFQDTNRLTDSELLKYFYLSRNYFFFAQLTDKLWTTEIFFNNVKLFFLWF